VDARDVIAMPVLYCKNCARAIIFGNDERLVHCPNCKSTHFGTEPPQRMQREVVISANDRRFLRSIRARWGDVVVPEDVP
jgi:uncharacterized Zn finger protein